MNKHLLLILSTLSIVQGYMNFLLVGPLEQTYPLAQHYCRFYHVPFLQNTVSMYPQRFVMISEEKQHVHDDILTIDIRDYPHKEKNPNYFISWVKQTFSS